MIKSEFIRIGTDRGGSVEITLREDRYQKPGEKSVKITAPAGAEFKIDHPKDVSEFLKLSIGEILGMVENLVDSSQEDARRKSAEASSKRNEVTGRTRRLLEI
jgi:hypothetical protein